jgi:NADPH:quinone reductase-like Zn-dependent oxidoreductase
MSRMNKVVITEFGDESKLAIVEDDLPDPAAGEVQLSVEYSIVSGSDVNMRRGTYPFQREASNYCPRICSSGLANEPPSPPLVEELIMPDLELLFEWLRSGNISVPIKATFRLEEIQEAHREYASSSRLGSIVIEINR